LKKNIIMTNKRNDALSFITSTEHLSADKTEFQITTVYVENIKDMTVDENIYKKY